MFPSFQKKKIRHGRCIGIARHSLCIHAYAVELARLTRKLGRLLTSWAERSLFHIQARCTVTRRSYQTSQRLAHRPDKIGSRAASWIYRRAVVAGNHGADSAGQGELHDHAGEKGSGPEAAAPLRRLPAARRRRARRRHHRLRPMSVRTSPLSLPRQLSLARSSPPCCCFCVQIPRSTGTPTCPR
jgi:hypothetical protein